MGEMYGTCEMICDFKSEYFQGIVAELSQFYLILFDSKNLLLRA